MIAVYGRSHVGGKAGCSARYDEENAPERRELRPGRCATNSSRAAPQPQLHPYSCAERSASISLSWASGCSPQEINRELRRSRTICTISLTWHPS